MNQIATILLLLSIPSISAVTANAQIEVTYDRFKDNTHFRSAAPGVTSAVTLTDGRSASLLIPRMEVVLGFTCKGQVSICKPPDVQLIFMAHTSDWEIKGERDVNLLIDGQPASAGKSDWDGQVLGAENLIEYNGVTISPDLLARMADAKTVEVQLGLFEFSLTPANLAVIRDIAGHAEWLPRDLQSTITTNTKAASNSPAAAAQMAQDGHLSTPQEAAQLVLAGKASRVAVLTTPPGATVYLDGNELGVAPIAFVLTKRDKPRTLTFKLAGYKTVEEAHDPDGKNIPIWIKFEKQP